MVKKSLQQIEDFYINQGYKRDALRKVLKSDKEYEKLLKERKQKLTKQFKITSHENKKYVLSTDIDFDILSKCKKLENNRKNISKEDRAFVKFIKTQLEDDWRTPLIKKLDKILKKYG